MATNKHMPDLSFLDEQVEWVGGRSCDDGVPERRVVGDVDAEILARHAERVAAVVPDNAPLRRNAVLFKCLDRPAWGGLSANKMADELGCSSTEVRVAAARRSVIRDVRVVRLGEQWGRPPRHVNAMFQPKPVVSNRAGEWWPSAKAAADHFRISPSTLRCAIGSGTKVKARRFSYAAATPAVDARAGTSAERAA